MTWPPVSGEEAPSGEDPPSRLPDGQRRWWLGAVVIAVALAVGSLLGYGFTRDPRVLEPVLESRPAPGFALEDMDTGRTIRLRDLRGEVVVLNFWVSWCVACGREHPDFLAAWDRYRDRGVVILGVLFQDAPANAQAYMEELGGDWPTVVDPGSRTAIDYGVFGVPETFFIGPDGSIAHKEIGESNYDILSYWINRLLRAAEGSGGAGGPDAG